MNIEGLPKKKKGRSLKEKKSVYRKEWANGNMNYYHEQINACEKFDGENKRTLLPKQLR